VKAVSVDVLLALAVASEVVCVLGVLLSATVYDRLHFSGATTAVAPFLLLAGLAIEEGVKSPTWNGAVDAAALLVLNGTLTHATARVARRRVGRTEIEL
jgi:multisubunit Na+/H+ antiporter MnhG subunit